MSAKKFPKTRIAKLVTLQPAHRDTINEAFNYLIDELLPESAARSPIGFAKRLAMKHIRAAQRIVGD